MPKKKSGPENDRRLTTKRWPGYQWGATHKRKRTRDATLIV
jgi:hypothetical protein